MNQLRAWQAQLPALASREDAPSHWLRYLDRVYGLDTLEWPLDLAQLSFFYPEVRLPARLRDLVPLLGRSDASVNYSISAGEVMTPPGKRRRGISGRDYLDVYHLYHPPFPEGAVSTIWIYPYAGRVINLKDSADDIDANIVPVRAHAKAEVHHCSDGTDAPGYTMYRSHGSGVFFDVGRTYVARNRCELWSALKLPAVLPSASDAALAAAARMSIGSRPRCRLVDTLGAWANLSASGGEQRTFGDLRRAHCPGFACEGAFGAPRDVWQQRQLLTEMAVRVLVRRGYDSVRPAAPRDPAIST